MCVCVCVLVCLTTWVRVCVRVRVCEREREGVCVCVCEREGVWQSVWVCGHTIDAVNPSTKPASQLWPSCRQSMSKNTYRGVFPVSCSAPLNRG